MQRILTFVLRQLLTILRRQVKRPACTRMDRMLLAYNRILYPYHKWLMRAVQDAPEKPANFLTLAEALLRERTVAHAEALWNCINTFRDWQITDSWGVRFMHDSEWTWRRGQTPLADW